ncbi:MAG: ribose-5-phosphate isomerase RpiA [Candidatus Marinimicrobia bacterium]|nr:ribose-5-phosphate isomerase RpiA [Candidatus Neomarinimicrobiota bacterium]
MTQDDQKRAAAEAALAHVEGGMVLGVGSGSTCAYFIAGLGRLSARVDGAVASSEATAAMLQAAGIALLSLSDVGRLPLYVDGADEANPQLQLIKGGGGALTREKILAAASDLFICIVDASKRVDQLGRFPLPVEVLPMAVSLVADQLSKLGGRAILRSGFTTDNGNLIIDVEGLNLADPVALESEINQLAGVVTCGLFARRPADRLIVGTDESVQEYH